MMFGRPSILGIIFLLIICAVASESLLLKYNLYWNYSFGIIYNWKIR